MSYTGFFAETDLYEVAKDGDAVEGLVGGAGRARRRHRRERLRHAPSPITGERKPVLHERGIVRLPAGRPGASAVRVLLHARGADPVRRLPGARGAARPGRAHAPPPRRSSS